MKNNIKRPTPKVSAVAQKAVLDSIANGSGNEKGSKENIADTLENIRDIIGFSLVFQSIAFGGLPYTNEQVVPFLQARGLRFAEKAPQPE